MKTKYCLVYKAFSLSLFVLLVLLFFSCREKADRDDTVEQEKSSSSQEENILSPEESNNLTVEQQQLISEQKEGIVWHEDRDKSNEKEQVEIQNKVVEDQSEIKKQGKLTRFLRDSIEHVQRENQEPDDTYDNDTEQISEEESIINSDSDSEEKIDALNNIYGLNDWDDILPIVEVCLSDPDPEVRVAAVEFLSELNPEEFESGNIPENQNDERLKRLLLKALSDEDEQVRNTVFFALENQSKELKLEIFKEAITSKYPDIKEEVVINITDLPNPEFFGLLISGLKDTDPEFREEVKDAIDYLVSEEFSTYEEANKWWNENKHKYDDQLSELDFEE